MIFKTTLLLCFFLLSQTVARAQCCSAGNPTLFSFSDQNSVKAKSLFLSSAFKYGYADTYFKGSNPEEVSFAAPASYQFLDLKIAWGISKRYTVQMSSGYFLAKVQQNPWPYPPDLGYGMGDVELMVRYRAFKSVKKSLELTTSAGLRLPVGVFDLEKDGVKLPITVQPSSGSFVYLAGLSAVKSFDDVKLKLYGSVSVEFPHLIDSKNFYYRYGDLFNLSVAVAYPVCRFFNPAIQIQGEMRGHATREEEQVVESSGYKVLIVSPQIESDFHKNWSVHIYADLPVYRYFSGMQLASAFKAGIGISKRFML